MSVIKRIIAFAMCLCLGFSFCMIPTMKAKAIIAEATVAFMLKCAIASAVGAGVVEGSFALGKYLSSDRFREDMQNLPWASADDPMWEPSRWKDMPDGTKAVDMTGQEFLDGMRAMAQAMPQEVEVMPPHSQFLNFNDYYSVSSGVAHDLNYSCAYTMYAHNNIRLYRKVQETVQEVYVNLYRIDWDYATYTHSSFTALAPVIVAAVSGSAFDRHVLGGNLFSLTSDPFYKPESGNLLIYRGSLSTSGARRIDTSRNAEFVNASMLSSNSLFRFYYTDPGDKPSYGTALTGYVPADYYDYMNGSLTSEVIDLKKDRDYLMQVITGLERKLQENQNLASSVISIPVGQTQEQTDAIILGLAEALAAANANANVNTQALIEAITKAQEAAQEAAAESTLDVDLGKLTLGQAVMSRFPFCIPFDLVNAIGAFSGLPRTPPKWTIPVKIMDTNNSIVVDFAQFEVWAKIIRWGVLISFNIGLILVTRKLVKG